MLATLILSAGVPMLSMGDEVSRSQKGSNNAYTQPLDGSDDLGVNLKWDLESEEEDILNAVAELTSIRTSYLAEISSEFFSGALDLGTKRKDLAWFSLGGREMTDSHWHDGEKRSITVFIEASFNRGLLLLLNSSQDETLFTLPDATWGRHIDAFLMPHKKWPPTTPLLNRPQQK